MLGRLNEKLQGIKKLAEKATGGAWQYCHTSQRQRFTVNWHYVHAEGVAIVDWPGFDGLNMKDHQIATNAKYIAAAHPEIILELIEKAEQVEQMNARIAHLEAELTRIRNSSHNQLQRLDQLLGPSNLL